jgi:hypothetical protein
MSNLDWRGIGCSELLSEKRKRRVRSNASLTLRRGLRGRSFKRT